MAGKVLIDSRYARSLQIRENDGKLIFIPHRRPLVRRDYPDNIVHPVSATDRIDLISTRYYGTPKYGWVIADFNDLIFPDEDLLNLQTVILPSLVTLKTEILNQFN